MMQKYRRPSAKRTSLRETVTRFTYECVEACSLGTDSAQEFEQHLGECDKIWPEVRAQAVKRLSRGERFVLEAAPRDKEAPGQMELAGMPKSVKMRKGKR